MRNSALSEAFFTYRGPPYVVDYKRGNRVEDGGARRYGRGKHRGKPQTQQAMREEIHEYFREDGVRILYSGQEIRGRDADEAERQRDDDVKTRGEDGCKCSRALVPGRYHPLDIVLIRRVGERAEQHPAHGRPEAQLVKAQKALRQAAHELARTACGVHRHGHGDKHAQHDDDKERRVRVDHAAQAAACKSHHEHHADYERDREVNA